MGDTDRDTRFYFILLLFAVIPLFSLGLANHGLWTPDEPRVAEVGREMAESGDFAVPTLDRKPFLEEPPLYYAALAGLFRASGGASDRTARVPSAVFSFGGVLALFFLGRLVFGPRVAFISAFVMATCGEYLRVAHWVIVDSALTCFIILSLAFFTAAYLSGNERQRGTYYVLAYIFCALAFLAKGFIGIVLPALAVLTFLVCDRNLREVLRMRLWLGAAIFLAVTLPWHLMLWREGGGEYLRTFLVHNHLERFAGGATGHNRPFYYYLTGFPAGFAPWGLLIVPVLFRGFRSPCVGKAKKGALLAKIWFVSGFVLLSAASTKRIVYLMPLFAPVSLLTALFIDGTLTKRTLRRIERFFIAVFGLSPLLAGVAVLPLLVYASRRYGFDLPFARIGPILLFCVAASALSCWALAVRAKDIGKFWTLSGASVFVLLLFSLTCVMPLLDRYKSFVPFCDAVNASVPSSAALCAYKPDETLRGALPFYTGRFLREAATLPDLMQAMVHEKDAFVAVRDSRGRLEGELLATGRLSVVYRDAVRSLLLFKKTD